MPLLVWMALVGPVPALAQERVGPEVGPANAFVVPEAARTLTVGPIDVDPNQATRLGLGGDLVESSVGVLTALGLQAGIPGREDFEADYVVAGQIAGARDEAEGATREYEVVVHWTLSEAATGRLVYTSTTPGHATSPVDETFAAHGEAAVHDALRRLVERPKFLEALSRPPLGDGPPPTAWQAPLRVRRCTEAAPALPGDLETALAGIVVVKSEEGVGSGVIVSPDGFVWTAAHVLPEEGLPKVVMRSGVVQDARPVRIDPLQDVAILKLAGSGYRCLQSDESDPKLGTDLYAIGAPAGVGLEFSVSRGIVSGVRERAGWRYLQTDASINPGNSGGPLLDVDGHVRAVVSFKVAAEGFEGLGFGVPAGAIVDRLGIEWSDTSSTDLVALSGTAPIPDLEPVHDEDRDDARPSGSQVGTAPLPPPSGNAMISVEATPKPMTLSRQTGQASGVYTGYGGSSGGVVSVVSTEILCSTPCTTEVAPGLHTFYLSGSGYRTGRISLDLAPGSRAELAVRPGSNAGWIGGLVALGTGLGLVVTAPILFSNCQGETDFLQQCRSTNTTAGVLLGTGIGATVVSIPLLLNSKTRIEVK